MHLNDLINMANYDDVYANSTSLAFRRNYRNMNIALPMGMHHQPFTREKFWRSADLLRNFGDNMLSLQISLDDSNQLNKRMYHLALTHCKDSLARLRIKFPTNQLVFKKCFPKLRQLIFSYGTLKPSNVNLVQSFPSLENLVFHSIDKIGKLLKSTQRVGSLKHLEIIIIDHFIDGYSYHMRELLNFIAANPQLNRIHLILSDENIDTSEKLLLPRLHDEIVPDELMSIDLVIKQNIYGFSNALEHFKIRRDRIGSLYLCFEMLTAQISDYLTGCVNVERLYFTTVHYYHVYYSRDYIFRDVRWTNLEQLVCLTRLQVLIPIYGREDLCHVAMEAIGPFMENVRSIKKIDLALHIFDGVQTLSLQGIVDNLRGRIDLQTWMLTGRVLTDKLVFKLVRVSV